MLPRRSVLGYKIFFINTASRTRPAGCDMTNKNVRAPSRAARSYKNNITCPAITLARVINDVALFCCD